MFQRPTQCETEEDLLKLQDDFLARKIKPSVRVERVERHGRESDGHNSYDLVEDETPSKDLVRLEAMAKESLSLGDIASTHMHHTEYKQLDVDMLEDPEALMDRKDYHIASILSRIEETNNVIQRPKFKTRSFVGGFPAVPVLGKEVISSSFKMSGDKGNVKTQKSLFARQFMSGDKSLFGLKEETKQSETEKENKFTPQSLPCPGMSCQPSGNLRQCDSMHSEIHQENLKKISSMSEEEILEEQKRLKAIMDPKALAFLMGKKERNSECEIISSKEHSTNQQIDDGKVLLDCKTDHGNSQCDFDLYSEFNIEKDIVHMDVVEQEKVQWMTPLPTIDVAKAKGSARFDFDGNLMSRTQPTSVDSGLFHHGEEPASAGYTLEELFTLARSNFTQQRVLALQTFGNILEKGNKGIYFGLLESNVVATLLDAGIAFLLRWAIDENAENLFKAAVYAFAKLLVVATDQSDLDIMRSVGNCFAEPSLLAHVLEDSPSTRSDDKHTRTDAEILKQDVVKGLINMQILPRVRYILEVLQPTALTVIDCLSILARIAQHSQESAYEVFKCPRLLDTIFNQYISPDFSVDMSSISGKKEDKQLLRIEALRLAYQLCLSSKSIARKMWTYYDLQAIIIRNLHSAVDNRSNTLILRVGNECLHLWKLCITYGIGTEEMRDMHSFTLDFFRAVFLSRDDSYPNNLAEFKASVFSLLTAMVNVMSLPDTEHGERTKDPTERAPVKQGDWLLATSFLDLISCVAEKEFSSIFCTCDDTMRLQPLAAMLNFLEAFVDSADKQTLLPAVDALNVIENILRHFLHPWLTSETLMNLLLELRTQSLLIGESLTDDPPIYALPNYGSSLLRRKSERIPEYIRSMCVILSTTRLLRTIIVKHKGLLDVARDFVVRDGVLKYLKEVSSSPSAVQISTRCLATRTEHHFLYDLITMYQLLDSKSPFSNDINRLYHLAGLKLFSLLQSTDSHLGFKLLSDFLLQSSSLRDCILQKSGSFQSSAQSTSQEVTHCDGTQFVAGYPDLAVMNRSYLCCCFAGQEKNLTEERMRYNARGDYVHSFLGASIAGLSQPYDWMFKPIIDLYNQTYTTELAGKVISSLTKESIESIISCLYLILILEADRREILSLIPVTTRLVRLYCIFLIGSDAFLEPSVYHCLQELLDMYSRPPYVASIEFQSPIPGLTSFSDFYSSLLAQYSSTSYGDAVFSNYLLFPLRTQHSLKFRRALWSEHADILRIFSLPLKEVRLKYEDFFENPPINEELAVLYSGSFFTPTVKQQWAPLLYAIAVHHISTYIFYVPEELKDEESLSVNKRRLMLLNTVANLKDETKRKHILFYQRPNSNNSLGFDLHEHLPPLRELLITNRKSV